MAPSRSFDVISLRVTAIYLAVGTAWIVLSDRILALLVSDPQVLTSLQTLKGWAYVMGTSLLLYGLVHANVDRLRRSEEALQESRRALVTLMGNLTGMVYRRHNDRKWTMEFVSDGSLDLAGYAPGDLTGNRAVCYGDLIHPEDRENAWDEVQAAVRQRGKFQLTYRITTASAEERWVWEQGVGVYSPLGEVLALEGFITDITRQKAAEKELTRLGTALDQTAEAVIVTDAGGVIRYVNPAFETTCGYARDEAVGQGIALMRCDSGHSAFDHAWAAVQDGKPWRGHLTCRRRDDSVYEADSTISPVRDERGRVVNYVAVNRDVTERMQMERQLHQAQKLEALGTMAGGIAHDFNNILTPILGFAELLLDGLDGPITQEQRHDLERIAAAGVRAQEMIGQVLTFARQGEMETLPLRLGSIVKESLKLLAVWLPKTIEIRRRIDAVDDLTVANPSQLDQVLLNLYVNAVQAMGDQPGVLEVGLEDVEPQSDAVADRVGLKKGSYLRLTVSDTGGGMPPEVAERVFEPFFTTKAPGKGTGMGLAVVHGIVQRHGGAIAVSSVPGRGTTFAVYLPKAKGEREEAVRGAAQPVPSGTERVLLVDDEEPVLEVGRRILENLGYRVTAIGSAPDALDAFGRDPGGFDLVIANLAMPKMSGLTLIREILALRPDLPAILCTGYGTAFRPDQADTTGIRQVLAKPLAAGQLGRAVRAALDGDCGAGPPEAGA